MLDWLINNIEYYNKVSDVNQELLIVSNPTSHQVRQE